MTPVKIVSYNLRCCWKWTKEGINSFIFRAGLIYEKIGAEAPDIIAFQEVVPKQLELLSKMFPEYAFYGQGRDADFSGEGLYIAIRKENWDCISHETFWISPTPSIPASRFEIQSEYPRICVDAELRHKATGKILRIYDIHLDNISDEARILGIRCVAERIAAHNASCPRPFMLMGDFNAMPNTETIRFCNEDVTPNMTDITAHIADTYHGYGTVDDEKIDYIYVSDEFQDAVLETGIWQTRYAGIYLSDHYPVYTNIDMEKI